MGEVVQWDILFYKEHLISHLCDEATRWTSASLLPNRTATAIIQAISADWLRMHSPMRLLVADQESALQSGEFTQWRDHHRIEMRSKEPGSHANVVERHHDLLRRILHVTENQLEEQGVPAPFDAILCESVFAKNAMLTVAGATPFQAVLGRAPPILAEFEPQSSILHEDGGLDCIPARGVSRIREQALQAIIQETARQRLRRAAEANTRRTTESLALVMGDLIEFHRPPTSKDDSGWRGPARVTEVKEGGSIVVNWNGRFQTCRVQDVRLALVPFSSFLTHDDEWARAEPSPSSDCMRRVTTT